jgi:hypothetical protein
LEKEKWKKEQENYSHKWDLFFAFGESHPGVICSECGAQRHLNCQELGS